MTDREEAISVLIIEDEPVWSDALTMNLIDFGYTVVAIAATYQEALAALGTYNYDIVLLDIMLDTRDSSTELGNLLRSHYHKPFIYITGVTDRDVLKHALAAGPSALLSKPVSPVSLVSALQLALSNFQERKTTDIRADNEQTFFFVKSGEKYKKIDWKDVVFLRSDKKYTALFYSPDKVEYYIKSSLSNTLRYIIPPLLQKRFLQLNRAEAVHIPFVTEFAGDEVRTAYRTLTVTEAFLPGIRKELRLTS